MRHRFIILFLYVVLLTVLVACTPTPENVEQVSSKPAIYPDYTDVTIPVNIAPLNFLVRGDVDAVEAVAVCGDEALKVNSGDNSVCFDLGDWKDFMTQCEGKDVVVSVTVREAGKWKKHKDFKWTVVNDSIDPYLTYRLIEPDYEVWNHLTIQERCVENFDTRAICHYDLVDNRCMNCHTYSSQSPEKSMMYVRGEGGGAILNEGGSLSKLGIKTDDMVSGSVYFGFSPSGRYITFSTNIIIPAFHGDAKKRMEVFDSKSDVYVADLETKTIISSPLLTDSTWLETFPTFSADGKHIYYCTADGSPLQTADLRSVKYKLCSIDFDEKTGSIGTTVDTLEIKGSVCHPRVSPDGKYILYTVADYGTFPIWHPEADLQMLNLKTGEIDSLAIVNSNCSDTYHSWSSNSRWFVFASKRDDGLFGKPYFCYIDKEGRAHKPFALPQESPCYYDETMKSFNAPELGRDRLPFTAADVMRAMNQDIIPFSRGKDND